MRLHAILVFTLLICASASAERILELFIRPASSSTLLHRGTITVTGLEPSSKPSARFEEATTKDMEQPTSGVIVAVLKDEETGEQWTSRVKTCSTTKPEQAVIHVDAEGHLYHFDFYLDCKAKSSKVRTSVSVNRPYDIIRPRYHRIEEVEKEELKKATQDVGFFQKYWVYIVPLVVLLLVSGGGEEPQGQGARPGGGGAGGGARR